VQVSQVGSAVQTSDEEAIRRVLIRYCHRVDARDAAGIAREVFTEDAVDDMGFPGGPAVGWDGIEAMFTRSNQTTEASAHFITNWVIDVDGDVARTDTYVTGWTWLRASSHLGPLRAADFVTVGNYLDEFRRMAEGWRISRRDYRALGPGSVGIGELPGAYAGAGGVEPSR
jgi:ketosteroid isomerase-like protein